MRALEARIGSLLLTRSPRGSNLSDSGVLLAGCAADVLAAAEHLDAGIVSLRSESVRQLHLVASRTIAEYLLPQWLVGLRFSVCQLPVALARTAIFCPAVSRISMVATSVMVIGVAPVILAWPWAVAFQLAARS